MEQAAMGSSTCGCGGAGRLGCSATGCWSGTWTAAVVTGLDNSSYNPNERVVRSPSSVSVAVRGSSVWFSYRSPR